MEQIGFFFLTNLLLRLNVYEFNWSICLWRGIMTESDCVINSCFFVFFADPHPDSVAQFVFQPESGWPQIRFLLIHLSVDVGRGSCSRTLSSSYSFNGQKCVSDCSLLSGTRVDQFPTHTGTSLGPSVALPVHLWHREVIGYTMIFKSMSPFSAFMFS